MTDVQAKRGARKAFREWLNATYGTDAEYRNGRYRQRTRPYGDYVYAQDREMFEHEFAEAMRGKCPGFNPSPWIEVESSSDDEGAKR